ncbi:type II secretion system protein GspM [Henriciella sp.]|uniref:type II secretion system protein GspM n=1 Tax=Henriciella sp. TaxID=1968823 RepID=UPI0026225A0B|nr:type II secretion system protein GspM [Henriciella sp.]
MSNWWHALSIREKALIAAAGGLMMLVVAWYGIITPSLDARAEARMARQTAASELAQLQRLVAIDRAQAPAARGSASASAASLSPDAFKTRVTQSAQSTGLAISRLQGGGAVANFSLVFEQADARQLFYWLNEVETRLGGQIERLTVDQAPNGRIRAVVEVSGGTS